MHFTAANTFLKTIHLFVYGLINITLKGQVHVVVKCRKTQSKSEGSWQRNMSRFKKRNPQSIVILQQLQRKGHQLCKSIFCCMIKWQPAWKLLEDLVSGQIWSLVSRHISVTTIKRFIFIYVQRNKQAEKRGCLCKCLTFFVH